MCITRSWALWEGMFQSSALKGTRTLRNGLSTSFEGSKSLRRMERMQMRRCCTMVGASFHTTPPTHPLLTKFTHSLSFSLAGSRANAYEAILKDGFDHRVANMGGAIGAGVYFATHASTSTAYVSNSTPSPYPSRTLFQLPHPHPHSHFQVASGAIRGCSFVV